MNDNTNTTWSRWEQIWSLRSKYESALPFSFQRPPGGYYAHPQGITPQEDAYIREAWARRRSGTYMSAFHAVRRGS